MRSDRAVQDRCARHMDICAARDPVGSDGTGASGSRESATRPKMRSRRRERASEMSRNFLLEGERGKRDLERDFHGGGVSLPREKRGIAAGSGLGWTFSGVRRDLGRRRKEGGTEVARS